MSPPTAKGNALHTFENTACSLPASIDFKEFDHYLAGTSWTEDQKIEYLQMLWRFLWEINAAYRNSHPVQQACGQDTETSAQGPSAASSMLNSSHRQLIQDFITNSGAAEGEEGVPL